MTVLGIFEPKCTGIWKQSAVLKIALKFVYFQTIHDF